MAKNDYTQKQTNKNNSENTQKNQSKNSTKESTSDCKDKNNQSDRSLRAVKQTKRGAGAERMKIRERRLLFGWKEISARFP